MEAYRGEGVGRDWEVVRSSLYWLTYSDELCYYLQDKSIVITVHLFIIMMQFRVTIIFAYPATRSFVPAKFDRKRWLNNNNPLQNVRICLENKIRILASVNILSLFGSVVLKFARSNLLSFDWHFLSLYFIYKSLYLLYIKTLSTLYTKFSLLFLIVYILVKEKCIKYKYINKINLFVCRVYLY